MPYARTLKTLLALALLGLLAPLWAQSVPVPTKSLHVGDTEIYEFDRMTTAAVGSPTVADIVPLSSRRLLVNARAVGETSLFVYDHRGRHQMHLAVTEVVLDLRPVAAKVQVEIGLPAVSARAVKDTLFLEGVVPSVMALQRAGAIAGVYAPKVKNLLTVMPISSGTPVLTLAETYAALLTDHLAETGIRVQVVDDKTIALLGQYAPRPPASKSVPIASGPARDPKTGQFISVAGNRSGTDAPLMNLKEAVPAHTEDGLLLDPLDRLLQSLPPDLRVVDLINIGRHPTRQILVRAKIIEVNRTVSAKALPYAGS